ncbi:MAG: gamma carbonic anhydrase family protein [bacterium]|nr:gamma carbonic anhydrase family protein [bacterium]MDT8366478.1 gamma carbonic anhydrase family protein [bacterium]
MIFPHLEKKPVFGSDVFIAPSATIIGDVETGDDASFWFGVVVRGDVNWIRIGSGTNIQDGGKLHVTTDRFPLTIGDRVSVGHGAIIHGCTIGDDCLIGIGAAVLDGASIGSGSVVAAGALVTEGARIPGGHLAMGIPARVVRPVREEETQRILLTAQHYVNLKNSYLKSNI